MTQSSKSDAWADAEKVLRMLLVEPLPGPGADYPFRLKELARKGALPATAWLTREFVRLELPLTAEMREVAINALDEQCRRQQKRKRGAPVRNADRDMAIVFAIVQTECAGLTPTRNEVSDHASGCDVVSEVLKKLGINLGYKGVATVWDKYQRDLRDSEAIANGTRTL